MFFVPVCPNDNGDIICCFFPRRSAITEMATKRFVRACVRLLCPSGQTRTSLCWLSVPWWFGREHLYLYFSVCILDHVLQQKQEICFNKSGMLVTSPRLQEFLGIVLDFSSTARSNNTNRHHNNNNASKLEVCLLAKICPPVTSIPWRFSTWEKWYCRFLFLSVCLPLLSSVLSLSIYGIFCSVLCLAGPRIRFRHGSTEAQVRGEGTRPKASAPHHPITPDSLCLRRNSHGPLGPPFPNHPSRHTSDMMTVVA